MKVPPAFFLDEETLPVLQRAISSAAVPVSLRAGDDYPIKNWGSCAACTWINKSPSGRKACCASRMARTDLVRKQGISATFVCHAGFTCVMAPALRNTDYVFVLGPFIPAEAKEEIAFAVQKRLYEEGELASQTLPLPFSLDDMRVVPSDAMENTASWLLETLHLCLDKYLASHPDEEVAETTEESPVSGPSVAEKRTANARDWEIDLRIWALALICGNTAEVRAFINEFLDGDVQRPEAMRSMLIRILSELLDAMRQMGCYREDAWNAYAVFAGRIVAKHSRGAMMRAADRVLRVAADSAADHFDERGTYMPQVMNKLLASYASHKLLTTLAGEAKVAPSSITRTFEKLTGANFSEVLGRIRIEQARRYLRATDMSATAIAEIVGIGDQSYFGKKFERYSGCTPGEYKSRK